jgi:hypothetical protein
MQTHRVLAPLRRKWTYLQHKCRLGCWPVMCQAEEVIKPRRRRGTLRRVAFEVVRVPYLVLEELY